MELKEKIVDFRYCNSCKYKDKKEDDYNSPCPECLDTPYNFGTNKPQLYENAEKSSS